MADIERAELLRTWVAALRSGKYRQGFGASHREDGSFCALGVLQDVGRRRGEDWEPFDEDGCLYLDPIAHVRTLAVANSGLVPVVALNDEAGLSFNEIADEIEAAYSDVFGEKVERGEGVGDAYLGADASAHDEELAVA